jgi:thioesterase domain-containing protein/acyl carrier protein
MTASSNKFMSGGTKASHSGQKLPDTREELFEVVRTQNPKLQVEDAFVVPVWFAQQNKWLEDPTGAHSTVYNYPLLLRIRGPLNVSALQKSLEEIVRRHGVFRSVFRIMDKNLVQIVLPTQEFSLPLIHLEGPPEARELQMLKAARREAMLPFDLTQDSVIRCKLIRLQADNHVLQLTTHTLVYDDWSSGVLIRELSEMYCAFAAETVPLNPPLMFQFGDFVRWYHHRLQSPEFESHLDYWKQQLDTAATFDHLTTDFARPARNTCVGATLKMVFPAAQAHSLKLLSRQERVSLYMVLLAGFKCLLHRYSGHEEIGVGTCAANRPLEEAEGLIGRFGNSMLLRTNLSGNPTFSELLKRVREVALNAWSNQELPLGMLLQMVDAGTDRNRNSPFRVMFNLQNAPKENWQLPGLTVDWLPLDIETSKLDMIVWLKSEPALEITLEYSTQLFESARMKKLLVDYQAILETMVKDPKQRVNEIPISAMLEPAGAQSAPTTTHKVIETGHRAGVETRMIELWKGVFASKAIDVTQNFFELGGDSLMAVRLFTQINKTFQCSLPLTVLLEAPTIKQLVQILCNQPPSSCPLVSIRPGGKRPPLFCLYGNHGDIDDYFNLVKALGDDQPVFGIRSSALEDLSRLPQSLEEAAAEVVHWIRKAQPRGIPSLLGYSWAGLLAFEVSRQLAETSGIQCFTAMVGTLAPMRPTNFASRFSHFVRYFPSWFWNLATDDKHRRRRLLRWKEMIWSTKKKLTEGHLPVEELVSSSPISRHMVGLMDKYHPLAGSNVTIDLFLERDSYQAQPHPLAAWRTCHLPDGGWQYWVHNQPRIHWLKGDHWSIIKPPLVSSLAESIRSAMDQHFNLNSSGRAKRVGSDVSSRANCTMLDSWDNYT